MLLFGLQLSMAGSADSRLLLWLNQFGITGQKWLDNYGNCGGGQRSFNYVALGLWEGLNVSESFSFNNQGVTNVNELMAFPYFSPQIRK